MINILLLISLITIFLVLCDLSFNSQPACAALPPLSDDSLEQESQYIVIGTVIDVIKQEVFLDLGSDYHYTASIKVEEVTENSEAIFSFGKEIQATLKPPAVGQEIKVNYWQIGKRPSGLVGPIGQNSSLYVGAKAKLYLNQDYEGNFSLLEPNGWMLLN